MSRSLLFYDLETSGLNPRSDRIMQFAGIRTDERFTPIGEPINLLVKLSDDTLPSPDALMVTGISPQKTLEEGYTEAEFARIFVSEICTPDTTIIGYNNIRFDDEFIRHLLWRNFYDPYEWSWKDGRSRWDMLDVVRMTRALRPEGIEWPVDGEGKPTNRLELITKVNGITHEAAHDALSDVEALIDVTKLIAKTQPQLYAYLFDLRDKKAVRSLVNLDEKQPFVYSSGRYDSQYQKTTVAFPFTSGRNGNIVVYDLRYDPSQFVDFSLKQIQENVFASWEDRQKEGYEKIPVKELQYNRAPAVAPLGVLEKDDGWKRIGLDADTISAHQKKLIASPHFAENVRQVFESRPEFPPSTDPEGQLYDGFLNDRDKLRVETVRNASERELADFHPEFNDERLDPLLLHYKARNYPSSLSESEVAIWESWRSARIQAQLPSFVSSLERVSTGTLSSHQQFIVDELKLWLESVMTIDD